MSFIELGNEFEDVQEAPLAPEGEYDLVVHDVEHDKENGKNNLICLIKFENGEHPPFRHWVPLPNKKSDDKNDKEKGNTPGTTSKNKLLMTKRFLVAFNIPFESNGFNPMDIKGARARLGVGQREFTTKDGQSGIAQTLKTPSLPKT